VSFEERVRRGTAVMSVAGEPLLYLVAFEDECDAEIVAVFQ
jgi:hypothetical protein